MKIVDLSAEHEDLYFHCLEDWSAEMREAGSHKESWYRRMKDQGLRVKLARDEQGVVGGMIQYLPVEKSFLEGQDLYFIHCIWVHGYKQGRGNFQRQGMGRRLLEAAEEDARSLGARGMAAWGLVLPFWMRASWFKKRGYRAADRDGISVLLWKPFTPDASPPRWVRKKKSPQAVPGQVTVCGFINGWCPAQNLVFERARRAAAESGGRVVFQSYPSSDPSVFAEWGISDALYIDGKAVGKGPPLSYDKIKTLIDRRLKRLKTPR